MKNILLMTVMAMALVSCAGRKADECIDPDKINANKICTKIYKPVCGCDGKTYGNECLAEGAGLKSWVEGECEE